MGVVILVLGDLVGWTDSIWKVKGDKELLSKQENEELFCKLV